MLILSCFSPGCCLHAWDRSILHPPPCFYFPEGFCFLGLLRLLNSHRPVLFFFGITQLSPVFSFDAIEKRFAEGVPVSIYQGTTPPLFAMWSNMMYDFHVPTSSALRVSSSRFSLTATSGHPSCPSGLRISKGPQAFLQVSYLQGTMIVNF